MFFKRLTIIALFTGLLLVVLPVVAWAGSGLVVIDPGHGGSDSGAVGPTGFAEKTANLDIGLRIERLLRKNGRQVKLTRSTDRSPNTPARDLTGDGRINISDDLQARVNIANDAKAKAFVSIHNNAGPSSAKGTETYYWTASASNNKSQRLAGLIQKELVAEIGLSDRGTKGANFYVLRRTDMPAALVEGAFISNSTEEGLLKTSAFRQRIAAAVYRGIVKYLGPAKREPKVKTIRIKPNGRVSLNMNKYFYEKGISQRIVSNVQVVAERSMYFGFSKTNGGSVTLGARRGNRVWHFAEGFTGSGFDTWLILTNMRSKGTVANITYMTSKGIAKRRRIRLAPGTRASVHVNNDMRQKSFSIKVSARLPIVVERSIFFNSGGMTGGHSSFGVQKTASKWVFVGGYQVDKQDTWLLLSNPGRATARVNIKYTPDTGAPEVEQQIKLRPKSRESIYVNGQTNGVPSSIVIRGSRGIVAERSIYFQDSGISGVLNGFGVNRPAKKWFFAEGNTNKGYNEKLMLRNFSDKTAKVKVDYLLESGRRITRNRVIPPRTSQTVNVNSSNEAGRRKRVATRMKSNQPIVAERAVYFNVSGRQGGHSAVGSKIKSKKWFFAEGFTGAGFQTNITISNPNSRTAKLKIYFYK